VKDTIARLKEMAVLWNNIAKKKCSDYSNVRIELLQPGQNQSPGRIFWPEPTIPVTETENTGTRDLVLKTNIENEDELSNLVVNPESTTLKIQYKDGNSRRIAALMVDYHSTIADRTFQTMVDRAIRQNEDKAGRQNEGGAGHQNEDGTGLLKQAFKVGTIVHAGNKDNNSYVEGAIVEYKDPPGRYLVRYIDGEFDYYNENEMHKYVKPSQKIENTDPTRMDRTKNSEEENPFRIYEIGIKVRQNFKHSNHFFEGVVIDYSADGIYSIQYHDGTESWLDKNEMYRYVESCQGQQVYRIGTIVENKEGHDKEHPEGEVKQYDDQAGLYVIQYPDGKEDYYTQNDMKQYVKSSQQYSQTTNQIEASSSPAESTNTASSSSPETQPINEASSSPPEPTNVVTEENNEKKRNKKRKWMGGKNPKSEKAKKVLDFSDSSAD
jgi:hypothetical protein